MSADVSDTERPGIDRLNYFLSTIAVGFATSAAMLLFGSGSGVARTVALIMTAVGFVLDVMRLRNIGVSQWFVMVRFLPFVNLTYWIGLLSAQGGWAGTQRLDKSGRTIASFLVIFYIAIFLIFSLAGRSQPLLFPFWG